MADARFMTVAKDMDGLIEALDVDDVADLETLLIVLFGRPITIDQAAGDDDDHEAFEVIMWNDTVGTGTTYAFPTSVVDVVLGCASTFADMQVPEDADLDDDGEQPDLRVMDEDELMTTLQRALGQVRIYNMLYDKDEA